MPTVLVRGLADEGPGDVVGAFAGEADVDPDRIGEIEIEGEEARVDLDLPDDELGEFVERMDGNRVGRSEVSVTPLDDETRAVRAYVEYRSRLVELEREAEMERHEREIRQLSGRERESKGRALLGMGGRDGGEGLSGHLVKFTKRDGDALPDTEIGVGDLVMVSKQDPLRDDNPTATVTQVTNHSVTVSFETKPPGWLLDDGVRLDLYVNDVTYQRMLEALERLLEAEERPEDDVPRKHLRDVIVGLEDPGAVAAAPLRAEIDDWHDDALNDSQRRAVERAVATDDVHLIHGPPGTGKTTTAVEAIRQAVDRGDSVLATAASNTAVDNVVEFLAAGDHEPLRVGHPARVTPTLREHTLDARLEDNETYRESREVRDEAFDLLDEQDELTAPSGRWRRGLSDERIKQLAEEGRGSRGIPPEKIEEMAEWLELRERADELFDRAERLENEAIAEEIERADVVCTTNSTAGSDLLADHRFDTLVIDEATQATEPSCLIPLVKADRVVMAGDHRQLPPTIRSREAEREGLDETLFERLAERYANENGTGPIRSPLTTQYRMHERIQDFSSERFYDGALEAHASVRDHTLAGLLPDAETTALGDEYPALRPDEPVVFVDTSDADAPERSREGSPSRENPFEAERVAAYARRLLEAGIEPADLAVISPYDDQVARIEDELADVVPDGDADADADALEVDTVDGFQGREKEVVLVSLVRSNDRREVGFLEESRRFNVALTRARRKAVVVGDGDTVAEADVLDEFLAYARERGSVVAPVEAA
ncbi:DNA helicase, putative [Halobiforma haloterrestris]|uniref:DNA helicase n=1 Tax=Natronobacterium haloterrestre TaxID=148448 RepID=A0A1I1J6S6_NATHA|nr:IGHMBP2 family helicase [Halobiforma haloterrestris]SFC41653.1 DNA helicase, putative [Halobiforma haloterrestris]